MDWGMKMATPRSTGPGAGLTPRDEPDEVSQQRPASMIGSVDNVLRLLRLLETQPTLRINEVSRQMGLSRSTIHRIVTTLQHHGFVQQDRDSRSYMAGPVLQRIGLSAIRDNDLRVMARPYLERLRDDTDETVHLTQLQGTESVFLDGLESRQVLRAAVRTGESVPAHVSAAGKVMLAELSEDQLRVLYPTGRLAKSTERSVATRAKLEEQLREVRAQGYAVSRGESEVQITAVAAPIRDRRGRVQAAFVVVGPTSRVDAAWEAEAIESVVSAAHDLGRQLI
jgi:IclR family transcriptional regulator, acetate operon repressor